MIDYKAFHQLSYGLYLICTEFEGTKAGYAGNTVFQVTSQPPILAISCNKENLSCSILEKRGAFSISVLAQDLDVALIGRFGFQSGRDVDKFKSIKYKTGVTGVPVVTESVLSVFECRVVSDLDLGTHKLFFGEVVHSEILGSGQALTYQYYHSHYKMLSPRNAPTYIDPLLVKDEVPTQSLSQNPEPEDWICALCGYVYHPESGEPLADISPGISFEDLPDSFECPVCRAGKNMFKPYY